MNIPMEHEEQKGLFVWAKYAAGQLPLLDLLFAIPNGGQRNKIIAVKLKAEGVKAGVPDMFFPVPRHGYHGLFIEMKRQKGGRTSPEQKEWHDNLKQQGYQVKVCRGFDEARDVLMDYLK